MGPSSTSPWGPTVTSVKTALTRKKIGPRSLRWIANRGNGGSLLQVYGTRTAWAGSPGALWTVANERDELGSDLVPDYLTSVKDGGFYGWPFSYYGQHVDTRVEPQRPDLVAKAIVPDYALSSHVAPIGFAIYAGQGLPANYRGGAFV